MALCRSCYDGEPGSDLARLTVQEFTEKWAVEPVRTAKFLSNASRLGS